MKAQLLSANAPVETKPLSYQDVERLDPAPDEIEIKVLACGMCLTDKHIIEGDIALHKTPIIPGHQIVGIVERIGEGVKSIKVGEKVGVPWLHSTCNHCDYCHEGLENLCDKAQFTGYDALGGYAEYAIAKADYVIPLDDEDDPIKIAPLLCAGIVGYRSYKLCKIAPKKKLGLIGFGGSAHLVIQVAKHFDNDVVVYTRSKSHQQLALKLGASRAAPIEEVQKGELDAAIIFAPAGELVLPALTALKKGATLAINAIHTSDIPSMTYDTLYHEREIKSVANATREDGKEFIKLAKQIGIKSEVVTYPLAEANEALIDLKTSKINGSAVLTHD